MDLDAILARKPQVALVDELAHTNVPGSRHEKRWRRRRGAPRRRDQRHLDDERAAPRVPQRRRRADHRGHAARRRFRRCRPPRRRDPGRRPHPLALRNRLARGDIYPAERIDTALANYFRAGNLTALRELAARLARRPRRRGPRRLPGEARHRRAVGDARARPRRVSPDRATASGLIRRAARIAQRSKGDLVGVHVVPQDGLAAADGRAAGGAERLLEELDGTYHEVVGADIGAALLDAARRLNATQIVMGAKPSLEVAAPHARIGHRTRHPRVGQRHRRPRREPP